jgi:hypothetical protein
MKPRLRIVVANNKRRIFFPVAAIADRGSFFSADRGFIFIGDRGRIDFRDFLLPRLDQDPVPE